MQHEHKDEPGPWAPSPSLLPASSSTSSSDSSSSAAPSPTVPVLGGATTDRYVWTQTREEIELTVPLALGTRAKAVTVDFGRTSLRVAAPPRESSGGCGASGDTVDTGDTGAAGAAGAVPAVPRPPLLDGELPAAVNVDDCTWSLCDDMLQVTLSKREAGFWGSAFVGDPEVLVRLIGVGPGGQITTVQPASAPQQPQPRQITDPAEIARLQEEHPDLDIGSSGRVGVQAANKKSFKGSSSFAW